MLPPSCQEALDYANVPESALKPPRTLTNAEPPTEEELLTWESIILVFSSETVRPARKRNVQTRNDSP